MTGRARSAAPFSFALDMATELTNEDLEDALLEAAVSGIAETSVDGMNVREHRLKDRQDILDAHKNETAAVVSSFGMRSRQLLPPGGGG